jgi:hypothetical protein
VAGRCTAGVRGALGVPSFHSCSPACDDLRRRAGHLAIARLAEADSQVRRPALRIVLPGCSIRDQGRWVCAFRRDGSPAALARSSPQSGSVDAFDQVVELLITAIT